MCIDALLTMLLSIRVNIKRMIIESLHTRLISRSKRLNVWDKIKPLDIFVRNCRYSCCRSDTNEANRQLIEFSFLGYAAVIIPEITRTRSSHHLKWYRCLRRRKIFELWWIVLYHIVFDCTCSEMEKPDKRHLIECVSRQWNLQK